MDWCFDTCHLSDDDPILHVAGDDTPVSGDHDNNAFQVYFQNINGSKLVSRDAFEMAEMGLLS